MIIYILFFTYLIFGTIAFGNKNNSSYLRWAMIFLAGIIGLRSTEVGVDTSGYVENFKEFSSFTFDQLLVRLKDAKEPLYVLGTWLVGCIFNSSVAFIVFWGAFPCVAIYYALKYEVKLAKGQLVSILCLFALGLFAFFVAGIRQTAAISVVLLAYRCLTKEEILWKLSFLKSKQFLSFCLLMLIAYNIHNSSLLFILAVPLLKIRVSWWYFPIVISLFFIGSFMKIGFLTEMASLFFDDRFVSYGTTYESSQSINAFIMQLILFTICYVKHEALVKRDARNGYLFNVLMVGLVFQSFSGMIYEMARVAFYFSIFAIILVPKAIDEYAPSQKVLLYVGFTVFVLIYLFFLSSGSLPEYNSALFK
ncbi:EpsG family protein [Bacteroides caccae]|uniref:EpsG family protein n=1 Tax=Bacteroides caccae TaxID=47678 RepID=A0A6A1JQZ0_9BACE|nr:EpsG family protein [Bacteroides caccae]KAA5476062.1 EpsG family protein [Bacteroides caccae]KAA5486988.1 EpsG family protein [Bacteroides caccae]KAA5487353.1 EpsG family protein [Bacteroides caccae]KAA5501388.1 EpsG family protein [Bacteroides caccae]